MVLWRERVDVFPDCLSVVDAEEEESTLVVLE